MHIIVELYPPLFTCMVAVKSLYLQQTCVFSLTIVLVMCSCNLSMELSRTFLFSYLSFCDCHLLLSDFDCHLQWGEFSSYLLCAWCTSNYCPREGSTFMVLRAGYLPNCKSVLLVLSWIVTYILHTIAACNALMFTDSLLKVACQQWAKLTSQHLLLWEREEASARHPPEHSTERPRE